MLQATLRELLPAVLSLLAAAATATSTTAGDAVLVEFHSPGCGPCRAMQPVVSELIARGVPVRQVNVAAEAAIATRYRITSTPTYVVLREGREVTRLVRNAVHRCPPQSALNRRSGWPPANHRGPHRLPAGLHRAIWVARTRGSLRWGASSRGNPAPPVIRRDSRQTHPSIQPGLRPGGGHRCRRADALTAGRRRGSTSPSGNGAIAGAR